MKFLSLIFFVIPFTLISQEIEPVEPIEIEEEVEIVKQDEIASILEVMPEFPGGEEAMHKFIVKNVKYPAIDREAGIQGRVYVKFVVEVDGSITNIQVLRGVSKNIDAECIRVIKMMPKWKAGENHGKKVRCYYTLPFTFKMQ